ncbi:MAG: hypothetical protein GX362_00765 [Methanosarcinaceae archaeon]|nr:hypothetical protein [Methanosarcinaceae archaeon]
MSEKSVTMIVLPFSELPEKYKKLSKERMIEKEEYPIAEELLEKAVHSYNEKQSENFIKYMNENPHADWSKTDLFVDLLEYYRQYIAYTNEKDQRCIWINLFKRPVGNWLERRVDVVSDTNDFFSICLNMETGKRFNFTLNEKAL